MERGIFDALDRRVSAGGYGSRLDKSRSRLQYLETMIFAIYACPKGDIPESLLEAYT